MKLPAQPLIYEIHAAVFLHALSKKHGRTITLFDIPDEEWQSLSDLGFNAVWLMGIWQRSPTAKAMGKENPELMEVLPDLTEDDILGSAYSIYDYKVDDRFGGRDGLAALRQQLAKRGIGLILDFVPNHVALDHPWTKTNADYFVQGTEKDLKHHPHAYFQGGAGVFAKGRDPNFEPWSDVAQMNAFSLSLRQAIKLTLTDIASQCDGVRCDMAMLMLNDIFESTWGSRAGDKPETEYWPELISATKASNQDFLFIAEVYWDKERILLEQGFDFCYDKKLYDALMSKHGRTVRHHEIETADISKNLLHFLENHDEKRAAHELDDAQHRAAAVVVVTGPGARLIHDGQMVGHKTHIPVHLNRGPVEEDNANLSEFYKQLLVIVKNLGVQQKSWQMIEAKGRFGLQNHHVLASTWSNEDGTYLILVNYSSHPASITVELPVPTEKDVLLVSGVTSPKPFKFRLAPWAYTIRQY